MATGIIPPIITPFKNEEVDIPALESNIKRWNQTGLSGHLVLGSNGEAVFVDDKERDEVLAAARQVIPPEMVFMVGAGQESTRATIAAVKRAAELGAELRPDGDPCYFKGQMTPKRLAGHFKKVADDAPIPVLAYNFPQATGVNMGPELVAQLAEHPNLVGVKDSSGTINQLSEIIRLTPDDFAVFVGNAEVLYPALCLGASGGFWPWPTSIPEVCVEISCQAHQAGDHARARRAAVEDDPPGRHGDPHPRRGRPQGGHGRGRLRGRRRALAP